MTNTNFPPEIPIRDFNASKQTKLFQTLKKPRFTGCLTLANPLGRQWHFYLYLGRLVYASGGIHPVRCWRRNLTAYMPQIVADTKQLQRDLSSINTQDVQLHWEYDLIRKWHDQGQVTREQISQIVQAITTEIFFDVSQSTQVTYRFAPYTYRQSPLILLDADQMIMEAWKLLNQWNTLDISHLSPNTAPHIPNPELLQARSSPTNYKLLTTLVTGRSTFWDLSIRMKRDVVQVARSIMPYIKLGFIDLINIEDLPTPTPSNATAESKSTPQPISQMSAPLIAYLDPDVDQRQYMGEIVKQANCRYLEISDTSKALSMLLARKPNVILLELNLEDGISGLDLCAQLKKLSLFRQTPILIVTDSSGIFDRVKSRLMGATDFLMKPIEPEELMLVLQKYLN